MTLPLLDSRPSAINARVANFLPPVMRPPARHRASLAGDSSASAELIEQAYRQIFFHAFSVDRDPVLEMRLRSGQISVRGFIRGLLLSDKFRDDFYRCNSNYRVVEQVVGRVLGRPVYGQQESIRWSIVIAQQGLPAFVDALLDSPEYLEHFGEDQVPFQRSRVLAGRGVGERPFNQQAPRYDAYWRDVMSRRAPAGGSPWTMGTARPAWLAGQPSPRVRQLWQGIVTTGGFIVTGIVLWTAFAMLSTGGQG